MFYKQNQGTFFLPFHYILCYRKATTISKAQSSFPVKLGNCSSSSHFLNKHIRQEMKGLRIRHKAARIQFTKVDLCLTKRKPIIWTALDHLIGRKL